MARLLKCSTLFGTVISLSCASQTFCLMYPHSPTKKAHQHKNGNVLLFTLIPIILDSIFISIVSLLYQFFFCYHSVLFLTDAVSWPCRKRDICIWMPPFAVLWQKPFRSKFLRFWKVARVPVKSIWYDNSIHSFWNFEPICNRAKKKKNNRSQLYYTCNRILTIKEDSAHSTHAKLYRCVADRIKL